MQLIECDRLVTPENKQNDKNFRAGIQFDKNNRPIAYYISKEYPGDSLGFYDSKIQRINATTNFGRKRVIHIFKQDRVDQSRGKPIFSPVLSMFKKLDMYEEAELTAAVVSAVVAMIVTTEGGSAEDIAKGLGLESPELVLPTKKDWPRNFANGKVFNLFPGEKLETFSPNRPNSAFSAFVENITKNICVATGLPYEMIMKDFSKCNYSSARAALQEGWERILTVRNWFIDEWVKEIYALFIEEIANKGLIEAPDFYKYKEAYLKFAVHGPVRGILDPVKEANAASIRMEQGISTLQEECAATGSNWEDTLLQKKKEQEFAKKLGLNITNLTVSEETTTKEQAESA